MKTRETCLLIVGICLLGNHASGQQKFADLVGPVTVQAVKPADQLEVPFITWGGDVATFLANDGVTTNKDSIYGKLGLNMRLVNGDDFAGQVKKYMSGETPLLRGTFRMLGQASGVLGADLRTKPVVILQLTWSAGDHVIAREPIKTLNDLKSNNGKKVKIACQQGGPHVGLLDDALHSAQLDWDDVEIVWVDDLTGEKGPADLFRKDASVDACCVISPDMIALTGGLDSKGSGADDTVSGAHVLVSTAQMSRSIADVYAVRSDWYEANRAWVDKFVAGYLKAAEEVVSMRNGFEDTGTMSAPYRGLLTMAQDILGEEVLPTLEADAHGLLLDCTYVGLAGNVSFFTDTGNPSGFDPKLKAALDLATSRGYAEARIGFVPAGFDYKEIAELAGIAYKLPGKTAGRFAEPDLDFFGNKEKLDEGTVVSFTINFDPNQPSFSADRYGADFKRAIQQASLFGNAALVIRGHSDPTKTLGDLVRAGMAKGIIQRSGQRGNYKYSVRTAGGFQPLDLTQTKVVVALIESGMFEGGKPSPKETMQAALNLSLARAEAVKQGVADFARQQGKNLDLTQVQPAGAGILEPLISKPRNLAEAKGNMRVEFRIVKVPAEAVLESDFDF